MTARIRRVLEVEISVRSVFDAPTIASLAREVENARTLGHKALAPILQRRERAVAEASREDLLTKLGNLSQAELDSVLQHVMGRKKTAVEDVAEAGE
jgi:hypothetical protein